MKNISVYMDENQEDLIEWASKEMGLDKSSFIRISAIEKAKKVKEEAYYER